MDTIDFKQKQQLQLKQDKEEEFYLTKQIFENNQQMKKVEILIESLTKQIKELRNLEKILIKLPSKFFKTKALILLIAFLTLFPLNDILSIVMLNSVLLSTGFISCASWVTYFAITKKDKKIYNKHSLADVQILIDKLENEHATDVKFLTSLTLENQRKVQKQQLISIKIKELISNISIMEDVERKMLAQEEIIFDELQIKKEEQPVKNKKIAI